MPPPTDLSEWCSLLCHPYGLQNEQVHSRIRLCDGVKGVRRRTLHKPLSLYCCSVFLFAHLTNLQPEHANSLSFFMVNRTFTKIYPSQIIHNLTFSFFNVGEKPTLKKEKRKMTAPFFFPSCISLLLTLNLCPQFKMQPCTGVYTAMSHGNEYKNNCSLKLMF